MDDGGRLVITVQPEAPDHIVVNIADNGCGMTEEELGKIYEPFYSTKTKTGGTGLGLSIVYRTLKENDAIITVDSIEGRMTTFTMFFQVEE